MAGYDVGAGVCWKWGNGTASGEIRERFVSKVTRTIKGSDITRNASEDDPAYLIVQDDGAEVLKGHSEVERLERDGEG